MFAFRSLGRACKETSNKRHLSFSAFKRRSAVQVQVPVFATAQFFSPGVGSSTSPKNFTTQQQSRSLSTPQYTADASNNKPGLFTIPGLIHPVDFLRLAKDAILATDNLRESISLQQVTTKCQAVEVLYRLDQISKTVCNVIDAAELCRSAHASAEWRDYAQRAFSVLQEYISTLNTDVRLYKSLSNVTSSPIFLELTDEEQRFSILLKREFELDGIHLPDDKRETARQHHNHVTNLETMFVSNITHAEKLFTVDASLVEAVIPRHALEANGAVYIPITDTDTDTLQKVQLAADTAITNSISSFATNGALRKQVHTETMNLCPENLDVLDALRRARHDAAISLGFASHADRFLQDKMASSPQNVLQFLQQLQRHIHPAYKKEMELLSNAKKQIEGGDGKIEPWDLKFYTKLIKSQQSGFDQADLAPYLSLQNCVDAMQLLTKQIFGLHMQEEKLGADERWDIDTDRAANTSVPSPQEEIRKFVFSDENGRGLGTMYLDLHPRTGKYTHAAHFTVQCGCVVDGPDSEYQLPIVALVCNMNTGSASFSTHSEVETLFHGTL
jgi:intermediate peptidase